MGRDPIAERLRHFEAMCRRRGVPLTVQRRDILQAVLERADHPSAEHVYETVKQRIPGLSRTTVYRVLDTLVEMGLVRRLQHAGGGARFDGRIDRHHHLVCRRCGCVLDIEARTLDGLRLPPGRRHGFAVEDYSVHFVGLCPDCQRDNPTRVAFRKEES